MATTAPAAERPHQAAKRYIYAWGAGDAEGDATMRDLLGGKGAGLAEMTKAGLPTPPGLHDHDRGLQRLLRRGRELPDGLWDDVLAAIQEVEQRTGKGFGDPANPLLVSVRSGAKFSMPGMMDTVLNLGPQRGHAAGPRRPDRQRALRLGRLSALHPDVRPDRHGGLGRAVRPRRWRRPRSATGRSRTPTSTPPRCTSSSTEFKSIVKADTGRDFPDDPNEQLDLAIKAVFASWFGKRAYDYRKNQRSPDDLGTAVNVVTMVFGNMGDDSGTGVAFTRDPNTGEKVLFGEYLTNAQGEDVVAGIRTARRSPRCRPRCRRSTRSSSASASSSRSTTATSRTSSSRSSAAGCTCSRRACQADRGGRREDRGRHGRRGHDQQGGGDRPDRAGPRRPAPARPVRPRRDRGRDRASPRASTRAPARPSDGPCSTPTRRSSGSSAASRSSSSGSRPRPTTSTAWPWPRAS